MPSALDWLATAEKCFADEYGSLRHGLLTSIFSLVIGMERIFHLDEMEDAGFARLCVAHRSLIALLPNSGRMGFELWH